MRWTVPQPWWEREWLYREYVERERSAAEIAAESDCGENNILYWLKKHGIRRRTIAEARAIKRWGLTGAANGMYGRTGADNPNWKGGLTPERQAFYASPEWAAAIRRVWKRDKGLCRRCSRAPKRKGQFHIHHRISFSVTEMRVNFDNLVLLCRPCHRWVHSKANRRNLFVGAFQATLEGGDDTSGV